MSEYNDQYHKAIFSRVPIRGDAGLRQGKRMKKEAFHSVVRHTMVEFARLTGLSPATRSPRRYLWTDSFAVCNFLDLHNQAKEERYRCFALQLVDQVHTTLGRHRDDDGRTGWISGLSEEEGKMHPTRGGLRIGKGLNERRPGDPFDERLEWDRDGQYFHYLTKWMHALNCVTRVTGDFRYNRWAMELGKTAHARFVYIPPYGAQKRMYWKMSIDLSYPLVPSMGHHDPLDGLITYNQLQTTGAKDPERPLGLDLSAEISDMADICEGRSWATDDPLGIGGLLSDAYRVAQLTTGGIFVQTGLLKALLDSSVPGLKSYLRENPLKFSAGSRLAFRELGLSIGLRAVEKLQQLIVQNADLFGQEQGLHSQIETLMAHVPLHDTIETFWLKRANQESESWAEHRDINTVMLATSLAPDGYLTI